MPVPALLLLDLALAAPARRAHRRNGAWRRPFISPIGEPFRARTPNEDTLARWFLSGRPQPGRRPDPRRDRGRCGTIFSRCSTSIRTGEIDPDEIVRYEWQVAPEIQVNSRMRRARAPGEAPPKADDESRRDDSDRPRGKRDRNANIDSGPEGAARYALLNMPEPVAAATRTSTARFRWQSLSKRRSTGFRSSTRNTRAGSRFRSWKR